MSPQVCACVAGGVLSNRTTEEERERPLAFFLVSLVLQRRMMELTKLPSSPLPPHTVRRFHHRSQKRPDMVRTFSVKPGQPFRPVAKGCRTCGGKGAIECPGCKGTGKNKKNGNIFERWKCFDCQGFGLKSCPVCGKGGLTPEQRGER